MRRLLRKRPLLGMIIVSSVATTIGIAISLAIDWFPEQASTASDDIDLLYDVLLIASVPIFVLVMSVALYSVFAFRARPGDLSDGAPIHGNTRLEVVWVTIPFIMVSALAVYGWVVLDDIEAKKPNTLVVNVTAQQFAWSFEYPEEKVKTTQVVLPKDRPVEFRIKSRDVLHSFWVPEFRLKSDAVPGITTKVRLTPSRLGGYDVVCAELCGLGHATMRQQVRVVNRGEYDRWLAKEQKGAGGGEEGADGKALFTDTGCNACHTLADAGSNATIGPSLDNVAADAAKYGKREGQTPEEYVKAAIEDPDAFVVPEFDKGVMPSTYKDDLSPDEIDALVKYLLDVGGGDKK